MKIGVRIKKCYMEKVCCFLWNVCYVGWEKFNFIFRVFYGGGKMRFLGMRMGEILVFLLVVFWGLFFNILRRVN